MSCSCSFASLTRLARKSLLSAGLAAAVALGASQTYAADVEPLTDQMASVYGVSLGFKDAGTAELREAFTTFLTGDRDKAYTQLQTAFGKNASLPPPRVLLARLFFAANRVDVARVELEQAAIENQANPEVYLLFGNLALAEGRLTDAALEYDHALEQTGFNGQPQTAPEEQKSLLRQVYAGQTTVAERRQDWERALSWAMMWRGVAGEDDEAQAVMRTARATFFRDDPAAAQEMLNQAIKLDKAMDPPLVTLAGWSSQKGDTVKAEEYMKQAIAESPEDARVQSAMSTLLLVLGRVDEAQGYAEKAATLDPSSDALKRLNGVIALHRKKFTEAERIFRDLYMKSPSDRDAVNSLAIALSELGGTDNLRRAQELAEINARQYPNSSQELATLGWVYYRQGRTADAAELLRKAVSDGQASSDTAYFLARVMAAQGNVDQAMKFLDAAVNVKGTFMFRDEAEQWLGQLKGTFPNAATGGAGAPSTPAATPEPSTNP